MRRRADRFVLRRFSGREQSRHVETQLVELHATRKQAAARAAAFSARYPRDAVLLVRGDRVLTCYVNGEGVRVTALRRALWENKPGPLSVPFSDRTPRERAEGFNP